MSTTVVLFHEYAHYFMFQHAPAAYPSWYSEGFAEVYGTLKLKKDGFVLGAPASHRSDILHYLSAFPVRRLLDPPEKITGRDVLQRYAMGWLLTHYLTFSGQRRGQLDRYFTLLNFGSSNLEAAEAAFGNLEELDRELTRYQRGRIMGLTVKHDNYVPPEVTTRALTAAEVAVLPYVIQSARGVNEKQAADVVTKVREIAETYPKSVYVLLALAEAEIDAQFNDRAAAAARRVLEIEPDNAKAHIYLGRVARRAATEDHTSFATMRSEFANAVRLDRHNAEALYGYYLSYQLAGVTPPEHALIAVEMAYDFAPFDSSIRSTLAHLLLSENRDSEALVVLGPIINDPHGGKRAERYAELAEQIKDGNKEEALSELAPKIEEHPDEDEEDEALSVK